MTARRPAKATWRDALTAYFVLRSDDIDEQLFKADRAIRKACASKGLTRVQVECFIDGYLTAAAKYARPAPAKRARGKGKR
jgi:hypothetical protein